MRPLETAEHPETLVRVAIDPVTRVEGHGKVTLLLDGAGRVRQARLHVVEFRGFERFIQGRPFWELPALVQRLCGICPVSHHLAAAKAVDRIAGVPRLPPAAEKLRRLLHFGQVLQSHATHFFFLASPDMLLGRGTPASRRNLAGLLAACPDAARRGIALRRFGQEVIQVLAGKRIHGLLAVPGGVNKGLSAGNREVLRRAVDPVVASAGVAVALARDLFLAEAGWHRRFGRAPAHLLSLAGADGALELYDGGLRARRRDGRTLFDRADPDSFEQLLREAVKPWSYMKFPFLAELGAEDGWYRVGPLARLANVDRVPTPLAEAERRALLAAGAAQAPMASHWARMIELLHTAEAIRDLLDDGQLRGPELRAPGARTGAGEGAGVIEAPRGTLFHQYEVGPDSLVRRANLIVSTTSNNQAMNESIRAVAAREVSGRKLTPRLLNRIEMVIRAYDPCLSCATHALGRMPLAVELRDPEWNLVDRLARDPDEPGP